MLSRSGRFLGMFASSEPGAAQVAALLMTNVLVLTIKFYLTQGQQGQQPQGFSQSSAMLV